MAGLGDPPGDRAFVGNAHDEALFSGHQLSSNGHGLFLAGYAYWYKMPVVQPPTAPHIVVMINEKPDPLTLFGEWYEEAARSEPNDPSAMSVASVGPDGMPSVRMVLLKGYDAEGFVFYTNTESRKGLHLRAQPKAPLLFHSKPPRRQVRLHLPVSPTTPEE